MLQKRGQFQLEPQQQMRRFVGSCRFVFNKALALQKERSEQSEKKLGYVGLCKQFTEWRNSADMAWLADAPVHPRQQTLQDLERALTSLPTKPTSRAAKRKANPTASVNPDPKQIKRDQNNNRIFLPKLGWLRYCNSRDVFGTVKNVTVRQSCGKW